MPDGDRHTAAIATGQRGAFTRSQANQAGLTNAQLRGRVQSGLLDRSGRRTYCSPSLPPSPLADLHALVLDVGTPCWISGPTGAALYGADGFRLEPPFHLLLPRDRRASRVNAIVHTTTSIDRLDTVVRHGLPVLSASRLVIDLASTESSERLTTALDCFLRDGFTAEDFLHAQINRLRSSGRYGIPQLLDVIGGIELSRGGHSWLERRYLQLIGEAGLPRPLTQQVLTRAHDRVVRVDCHFPGTPLIVELLGYKWHRTREQMGRDAERITALQLTGYVVAQFTYAHIATDPAWVVDTTREAYTLCSAAA